jgi:homogentisate phytyltransferase/homogentisate geranylgeranyltransferase
MHHLGTFLRFSRPHTIIATALQVTSLFIIAGGAAALSQRSVVALALALLSSLAVNVYIVGLNQITDIEIDRINKPRLPLAAGDYSVRQAWRIVATAGMLALAIAAIQGLFLFLTIATSFLIGSVYSLPPPRLKRYAFWAALSIAFVRGVVSNLGLYWHFRGVLDASLALPPLMMWAVIFFFGFGLVIALYKDIPDLKGDERFTVRTLTVRLGPARVFALGRWVLTAFYLVPLLFAVAQWPGAAAVVLFLSHLAALAVFWLLSLRVNPADQQNMARFYLVLWGLFYAEYLFLSASELTDLALV